MSARFARKPVRASSCGWLYAGLLLALLPAFGAAAEPATGPDSAPAVTSESGEPAAQPPAPDAADTNLDALSAELDAGQQDPFECVNRRIFSFNRGFDTVFLDPMTRAYAFVVPELARQSVRNVFANLNTPSALVNDLLQLEAEDALVTTARFVINSTMGMGGLFDAASTMGLERHRADFSETLATVGIPSGPYLIMPLLGPTTIRDGFGSLVDLAMAPQTYALPLLGFFLVTGSQGVTEREKHFEGLEALRESSIDYYASLRSAYLDSHR